MSLTNNGRIFCLGVTLAASAALLIASPGPRVPPATPTVAQTWPAAQRDVRSAYLPDGTVYQPGVFLDVRTSIGSAPSRDGKYMRLVIRGAGDAVREVRRIPLTQKPSFVSPTVAGDVLVWVENTRAGRQLWTAGVPTGGAARPLTGDAGVPRFYQAQHDLVIAGGRVYWMAAAPGTGTEIRSVALTGGPVDVRTEPGTWILAGWPWMADRLADVSGGGRLRNLLTGEQRTMPVTQPSETACTPLWCRVVSLDSDGNQKIEVVRPDGKQRSLVARGAVSSVIPDVAVLDRFEVFAQDALSSEPAGPRPLRVYDIATQQTVDIDAKTDEVSYRNGVLWWSTRDSESVRYHALDLRTV